ncbi:tetratricopeptide repeat protein [Parvularcula maris]|uniref:Tetratricopeptide repeat protein n=1 Tax=Parvularcula maris TaxID=2965077 RepID=A0A9X2RIQ4_9PROT|nr:tetratricopeptide repeat protein [Parvularcula maris]MCQ8183828.1 tetratricopeptide repeat protein [Parvularcula maris]
MKPWKLLGASVAVLALVACESGEEKAERFTENAQEYLEEGELQRAYLQFQNALQNDPNNLEALKGAAFIAEEQERYGDQLRFLQRIITLEPQNVDALAKIARLNLLSGQPDDALERADQALAIDPANLEALTVKGAAQVLNNNLDGASETLEAALAEDPENAEVRNLLAARYVRDEDFERAQSIIDEGLAQTPDNEPLLVVKLLLTQRRQDVTGMDETFQQLIATSPENGFYRERYGEFLLRARRDREGAKEQFAAAIPLLEDKNQPVGRYIGIIRAEEGEEAAETELRELVAQYPDTGLVFAIPAYLCEVGETERCEEELRTIASNEDQSQENRSRAKVQIGERAFARGDREEALEQAEAVLAEDEGNSQALTLKGKIQLANQEVEPAIETLRVALNNNRDNEAALILLGLAYEADGRVSFGEAQLAQAIDRLGLSPALFQAYRGMLVRNDKAEDAADLTLRYAQTANADAQVKRESAAVLLSQQRPEEAEVVARSLIRADANDQVARRVLATSLLQQQRPEEALEALEELSDEGKANAATVQIRAQALTDTGREDELRSYLESVAEAGDVPEAYAILTGYETREGNPEAALEVAQQGAERFPEREQSWVLVYNAAAATGDTETADEALRRGLEESQGNASGLRVLLSNRLLQENRRREALDALMPLYEANQLNDLTANNLAALMLDLDEDPSRALEIAKRFEDTEQPFLADTLAWAYYKNGDLERAQRYSDIAARAEEPQAEILYHRGVIAAANGQTDIARDAFEAAVEAPGKTEVVTEDTIRQALSELE